MCTACMLYIYKALAMVPLLLIQHVVCNQDFVVFMLESLIGGGRGSGGYGGAAAGQGG